MEKIVMSAIVAMLVIIVVLMTIYAFSTGTIDTIRNACKTEICNASGYDGHREIYGVDYCYIETEGDTALIPLLVPTPSR